MVGDSGNGGGSGGSGATADKTGTSNDDVFVDTVGNQIYDGLIGEDMLSLAGFEQDYAFTMEANGTGVITHADG